MTLVVTRREHSAEELRRLARRASDANQACRLLALAMVLDGASREASAKAGGMTRQTLRDWVIRYNALGIEGLVDRAKPGRPPRLTAERALEFDALVESGPDVAVHGVVRWRCVDLKAELLKRFNVTLSERSVGRILKQRRFSHISVRPRHPKADEAAQELFKKLRRDRDGGLARGGSGEAAGDLVPG